MKTNCTMQGVLVTTVRKMIYEVDLHMGSKLHRWVAIRIGGFHRWVAIRTGGSHVGSNPHGWVTIRTGG